MAIPCLRRQDKGMEADILLHSGVDMHRRYPVVTVVDDEGRKLVMGARIPNDELEILGFFKSLEEENK